jgi:alpha-tubulin suppressor-like RCC1 family protein
VTGLTGVRQLGIGTGSVCGPSGSCWVSETTCALQKDGVAKCWGPGHYGQLGNGKQGAEYVEYVPVTVALADIADLSVGSDSACAVTKAGEVWCWGRNDGGELGFTSPSCGPFHQFRTDTQPPPQAVSCATEPQKVPGLAGFARVAVARGRQCALHTDGHVSCWGRFRAGGSIPGTIAGTGSPAVPATVANVTAAEIAVADTFSCASRTDGTVACWDAAFGALTPLTNVAGVARIRAFTNVAVGFQADGTIKEWSSSTSSGLADTRTLDQGALDLGLHEIRSCVVGADRGVRCWERDDRTETEAVVLAQ